MVLVGKFLLVNLLFFAVYILRYNCKLLCYSFELLWFFSVLYFLIWYSSSKDLSGAYVDLETGEVHSGKDNHGDENEDSDAMSSDTSMKL